jgi:hypothetical protein
MKAPRKVELSGAAIVALGLVVKSGFLILVGIVAIAFADSIGKFIDGTTKS